jgi:RES domain-containing protein
VIHDRDLLDRLSDLPHRRFEGELFRATGISVDATASSINGGRWSPRPDGDFGIPALYTSFERDGALAELCSFLADFTPIPKARPVKVTPLTISVARAVTLTRVDLVALGVAMDQYGQRDYRRTQQIGAALAFLGIDGLIAPSPRWNCDNLVVFDENHAMTERMYVGPHEEYDWREWAETHGILPNARKRDPKQVR